MLILAMMLQLDAHWDPGAPDCKTHHVPPIEVHAYNAQTYLLRENPCATFEAPFMYLLVGSTRALLIDDGDVADSQAMPLAQTVLGLLPANLSLLVVHTHRHLDHRAGDAQFSGRPNVQVVGYDLDSVKRFYGFTAWPDSVATLDVVSFVATRPVTAVLGGHIELDSSGHTFDFYSHYHPHERELAMSKADVLALPAALDQFNGFYTESGSFIMMDQMRVLIAELIAVLLVLGALITTLVLYLRRRKRRARYTPSPSPT